MFVRYKKSLFRGMHSVWFHDKQVTRVNYLKIKYEVRGASAIFWFSVLVVLIYPCEFHQCTTD